MPSWPSLAAFGAELGGLSRDFTDDEVRRITMAQGREGEQIAAKQARSDLGGDGAFSGWNRGNPIPLDTHLRNGRNGATLLLPKFPGGWTVAEFGRNSKAGPRLVGPRLTRTGRVSRARQRRYNGVTRGKDTASQAKVEMDRKLPKVADRAVVKVMRKRFDVT